MKYFTQFRKQLNEYLTPGEKAKVNKWPKGVHSFSDHVFGSPDNHRVSTELEHPEAKSETHQKIEDHLKPHNIKVSDYKSGVGEDSYGRSIKLGKALEKTKAPDELKTGFQNDPARQQKKTESNDFRLNISRHHHDVAGMTSHGHSWENESCMNFNNGSHKDCLKQDLLHGTHVAYLSHKDDPNNEKPLARVALKPYHNIDNPSDTILRPEHRQYGNAPDTFSHSVNRFVDKHFPGKSDGIYKKNPNVYDDTKDNAIIGKDALDRALEHKDKDIRLAAVKHPNLSEKQLEKALTSSDADIRVHAIRHPNLGKKQIESALNDKSNIVRRNVVSHPKVTTEQLEKASKDDDYYVRIKASQHPNASKEHLHRALDDDSMYRTEIHASALSNPNADETHIDKGLDPKKHSSVRIAAAKHPNASKANLEKALIDRDYFVRKSAQDNPNAKKFGLVPKVLDNDK